MLWIKAIHLIAATCWFAGLFYLPRLFVYHAEARDRLSRERFEIMETRLYRIITTPSAVVTLVFGLWLITRQPAHYLEQGWLLAKLIVIALLIAYHLACGHLMSEFAAGGPPRPTRFYRVFNELPVLALIAIVLLAVLRPF